MLRKNIIIYGFLSLFADLSTSTNTISKVNMTSYLDMQLKYAKNELSATTAKKEFVKNGDFEVNVVFNNSVTVPLFYNYTAANIFSLFNESYVYFGPDFYYITVNNNGVEIVQSLNFSNIEQSDLFIKVAEYNSLAVMFVAFSNGVSRIYGSFDTMLKWSLFQSIQNEKNILDAVFFVNDNNFYLGITSSLDGTTSSFRVFRWNGAHFDEIDHVHTRSPSSLMTFQDQESQFIMFLENSLNAKVHRNLVIYQLNEDHLEKVQLLRTSHTDKIVTYRFMNIQYVAIFSETENSSLYWWNDSELVLLSKFGRYENLRKIVVTDIHGIPVLFVTQKSNLSVFVQFPNGIRLIHLSNTFEHYKDVLDIKVINNGTTNILLAFLQSCDNKLSYITTPFIINFNEGEAEIQNSEQLLKCLNDLQKHTEMLQNRLEENLIQNTTTTKPTIFRNERSIPDEVVAATPSHSQIKNSDSSVTDLDKDVSWINTNINSIRDRINDLDGHSSLLYKNGYQINGKTIIKGKLYAKKLIVNNLQVNYLNNKRWTPHTWLSYSKPQTITGEVYIKNLITTNTSVSEENQLNDLLFSNGNQNITGKFNLETLTANQLSVLLINGIIFDDIYIKRQGGVIHGVKTLHNVSADEILLSEQHNSSESIQSLFKNNHKDLVLDGNVDVKNLYIEEINNIKWEIFQKSVFRLGIDNKITGNLTLSNSTYIDYVFAKTISNVDVDALLTTTTNQIINSNLKFGNLMAPNVHCQKINNLVFDEIVTSKNTVVKGPVTIDNLQVEKHLHMNDTVENMMLTRGDHIMGTDESDLLQIYNKNVKIRGNLYLSNLLVSKHGTVIVDNKVFKSDDIKNYWQKSQPQVIPVHIEPKKGISTSHLTLINLNSIGFDNYLLNTLDDKRATNVIFENVTIAGNVFLNKSLHHSPDLQELEANSVKTSGSFSILGQKTVQGILSVSNLTTNYLDEIEVSNVVTSQTKDENIAGIKQFDTVIINGILVSKSISTEYLNNINLKAFEKKLLFLDVPEQLSSMIFTDIRVQDLEAATVNNVDLSNYGKYLARVYEMTTINDLFVNGNVSIENAQNVVYINNHDVNTVFNKIIDGERNLQIKNPVRFLGNVHADNIEVKTVNNVHFPTLVTKLFYRSWTQNITIPFTFDKIITPNINVPQINNIPTKKLINIKETDTQNLLAWGGLKLTNTKFIKSLTAEKLICNLNQAVYALKSPPTRLWSFLRVSQNATFWDRSSDLFNIFANVVNTGKRNIITAQVTSEKSFSSMYVNANNIVNGIQMNALVQDVILRTAEQQVIGGYKVFRRLTALNAVVDLNADISVINNISMERLNKSIVFKGSINPIIRGKKTFFNGLQVNQLVTPSISNMSPSNLINLDNLKVIPEAYFQSLEITNNLEVEFVNNISVPYIMKERLLCCSSEEQVLEGTYYFDTLALTGNTSILFLNKIPTEELVYNDEETYTISSPKTFTQDLRMLGCVEIELLNGESLSTRYKQAIHLSEVNVIKGDVILNDVSLVTADIKAENINGISVKYLEELMNTKISATKTTVVYEIMNEIQNIIKLSSNLSLARPSKFLYLERSSDLQMSIPNAVSARVVPLKNNVVLNVIHSENGEYCGLPSICKCQAQSNIQISEEESINTITDVGLQRIFSSENENMTGHLFTTSVSYSDFCRTNIEASQNESTALTLITYGNSSRSSYYFGELLTGYVSGVEYFTANGNTYMVVSRFYDPTNTNDSLNCKVYKFSNNEGKVSLIQIINTSNAWTIHVFTTIQGVVLIIGSVNSPGKSNIHAGAGVYRFNVTTENFLPLRRIAGTVMSATGIVVHANSLIALAENKAVRILKYHPKYDNYYYYQYLFFDSVVTGISPFYSGDVGISDVYLCIVTEDGTFYIYLYQYIQGWKLISKGEIESLRLLVPFTLNGNHQMVAVSTNQTFFLSALVHGSN